MEGCRILVTVPACLEILLLSPSNQAWARRIRYAILDEVREGALVDQSTCDRRRGRDRGTPCCGVWLPGRASGALVTPVSPSLPCLLSLPSP